MAKRAPLAKSTSPDHAHPSGKWRVVLWLEAVAARLARALPDRDFRHDFWPAFWATAVGALLSIPAGLEIERSARESRMIAQLPIYCPELKASLVSLAIFARYRDAPSDSRVSLRPIHAKLPDGALQDLTDHKLRKQISDAYAIIDEVNEDVRRYLDGGGSSQENLDDLTNASADAISIVQAAVDAIREKEGSDACQ